MRCAHQQRWTLISVFFSFSPSIFFSLLLEFQPKLWPLGLSDHYIYQNFNKWKVKSDFSKKIKIFITVSFFHFNRTSFTSTKMIDEKRKKEWNFELNFKILIFYFTILHKYGVFAFESMYVCVGIWRIHKYLMYVDWPHGRNPSMSQCNPNSWINIICFENLFAYKFLKFDHKLFFRFVDFLLNLCFFDFFCISARVFMSGISTLTFANCIFFFFLIHW